MGKEGKKGPFLRQNRRIHLNQITIHLLEEKGPFANREGRREGRLRSVLKGREESGEAKI